MHNYRIFDKFVYPSFLRQSELWAQKDVLSSRLRGLDSDLAGITTRVHALDHSSAHSKPLDFTPLQHPPPPPPPPLPPPPPMKVQRSTTLDFRRPRAAAASAGAESPPVAAAALASNGGGGGGSVVPPLGQETPVLMICFEVR